jgi:alkylhydroperoxidase/carboxymuconolactone decarboxylase family protein YurZ
MMKEYPGNYAWLMGEFGKVLEAHQNFGKELHQAGPLDEKTAQLIQLAGAASVRAEGAVHSHVKRALKAGAETAEIYHSIILLASTIGFPAAAAALSWAREIVEPLKGTDTF